MRGLRGAGRALTALSLPISLGAIGLLFAAMAGAPARGEEPAGPAASAEPMTLDDFIKLLEKEVPKPVARKVAAGFNKDDKLKKAWKLFKKKRGGKAPATEFVDFITRIPEFRPFMADLQQDAGFKQAFNDVAKRPDVADVLRRGMKAPPASLAARSGAPAQAEGAAQVAPPADAVAPAQEAKAAPGANVAGQEAEEGGPSALASTKRITKNGPGGYDVRVKMDSAYKQAGVIDQGKAGFEADRKFMTEMLKHLTNGERKLVEAAMCLNPETVKCDATTEAAPWGACFATGLLPRCRKLCSSGFVQGCPRDMLFNVYGACRDGDVRDGAACVVSCLNDEHSYGCNEGMIKREEWDAACLDEKVGRGLCRTSQRYGKECADENDPQCFGSRGGRLADLIPPEGSAAGSTSKDGSATGVAGKHSKTGSGALIEDDPTKHFQGCTGPKSKTYGYVTDENGKFLGYDKSTIDAAVRRGEITKDEASSMTISPVSKRVGADGKYYYTDNKTGEKVKR